MTIEWVFAVAPQHPLASAPQPLTETQRLAHRAVVVRDSSRESVTLSLRVLEKQQRLTVATIEQKIAAQCAGLGAGFLPRQRIASQLQSGQLVEIALETQQPDSTLYLAWRSTDRGRALCWFRDRLLGRE
jgi:DNA-binding transcriptional LysR family regulator